MMPPAVALVAALLGAPQAPDPALVYVYVGPAKRDGFVDADKDTADSIADIRKQLRGRTGVFLTADESGSDVVIHLTFRGTVAKRDPITLVGGSTITPTIFSSKVVMAMLEAGDYRKEFGDADDQWGDCAKEIGKQAHAWIIGNRAMLLARRQPKP